MPPYTQTTKRVGWDLSLDFDMYKSLSHYHFSHKSYLKINLYIFLLLMIECTIIWIISMSVFFSLPTHSFQPPPFLWSRNVLCSHILCINIFEITSLFHAFMLLDSDYQPFIRILNRFSLITKFKDCEQKQP